MLYVWSTNPMKHVRMGASCRGQVLTILIGVFYRYLFAVLNTFLRFYSQAATGACTVNKQPQGTTIRLLQLSIAVRVLERSDDVDVLDSEPMCAGNWCRILRMPSSWRFAWHLAGRRLPFLVCLSFRSRFSSRNIKKAICRQPHTLLSRR